MNVFASTLAFMAAIFLFTVSLVNFLGSINETPGNAPGASKDLQRFQKANPGAIYYNPNAKRYERIP